jgi:nicotinate phosphoribosyltransferase
MSILDNDAYKFFMQRVVALDPELQFVDARYEFINRGKTAFPEGFAAKLRALIGTWTQWVLRPDEKEYLRASCPFLGPAYLDFLEGYRYNPEEVNISQHGPDLKVSIAGPWYRTILWEVPLMAAISELYFDCQKKLNPEIYANLLPEKDIVERARWKADVLEQATFADFGTRRRFSYAIHDLVVEHLTRAKGFVGSSNVHLAQKYGLKPIGTQAHEWYMAFGAIYGFNMAHIVGMEKWVEAYQGRLGIALSDTYTTDVFFRDFTHKYAKLFDGVRHDSGDPKEFAEKVISHYEKLGINPMSKTIVFSDGLDAEKAADLDAYCDGRIKCSFGIGTNFSNDVGVKPLNMVIKMVACRPRGRDWLPTIKLSDVAGKHTGDPETIDLCKRTLGV